MSEVLKLALDIRMDVTLPMAADHNKESLPSKKKGDSGSSKSRI